MPLSRQADLLSLSRSSLYYQAVGAAPEEIALKHRIDEIYTCYPFYGSRRITAQLRREGLCVNRKAVQRHMRQMGIAGICPGPNLSKRQHAHHVYPYLLRGRSIARPNQVWGIDITYIRLLRGWMYLVALLDWHSRFVVSWRLAESLDLGFVLEAVKAAFDEARPEILNSDQGSQFTSAPYTSLLLGAGVAISMDGRGRALDNAMTERLWRSVKYEGVYLHDYERPRQARRGLTKYLDFYNYERPHQSLSYRTPAEVHYGRQGPPTKPGAARFEEPSPDEESTLNFCRSLS